MAMEPPPAKTLRQWLRDGPFDAAMNPSFMGFFAHTGAMGLLQREGLLENLCGLAGASAGAMCGALLASGRKVLCPESPHLTLSSDMDEVKTMGNRRHSILDFKAGFGVLHGHGLQRELERYLHPCFSKLHTPFACTAFSAYTLETEILRSGSLAGAVRASCTVPGLFQPHTHECPAKSTSHHWLLDGGVADPTGSVGLRALPKQPRRSLHVVVNRQVVPGLDTRWTAAVPPSKFGAPREEVVTLRLNRPPSLLLGEGSFAQLESAILFTAKAVVNALDRPMLRGDEGGHYVVEVDVAWPERLERSGFSMRPRQLRSRL